MKEIIGTIYASIILFMVFILGYINAFGTEKTLKKLYFKKTKFGTKLDDFFNISREEPKVSWIRFAGWIMMIFSILPLVLFLLNIIFRR